MLDLLFRRKQLTSPPIYGILKPVTEEVFFLCAKMSHASEHSCMQVQIHRKRFTIKKETEVAVVRVKITLACEECKQRNYNLTKDKKTHPDRMETKKYCKFCKAHTMHKETK